jgi:two-component system sensor histidine kinase/response regulator
MQVAAASHAVSRWRVLLDAYPSAGSPLPATDRAALDRLRRFGGATLLGKMIDLFLVAAPERIEAAARADAAGDVEGVERALHSLKSSSAQLGAIRMQRLSEQGEHRAREGSLDGVAQLTSELEEELARVREWLTTARAEGAE